MNQSIVQLVNSNLLLVFFIGKNKQQSAIIIAVIDIATTKDNRINT